MEENQTTKKRNYERYLEGETWSPATGYEQSQSDAGYLQDEASPYYVPEETKSYGGRENGYSYQESPQNGYSYQESPQNGYSYQGLEEPVSMGEWALCIFLNFIPCVGLIMMFVWAFSKDTKKSKSNFFKVQLIFMGIVLVLYLLLFIPLAVAGVALS